MKSNSSTGTTAALLAGISPASKLVQYTALPPIADVRAAATFKDEFTLAGIGLPGSYQYKTFDNEFNNIASSRTAFEAGMPEPAIRPLIFSELLHSIKRWPVLSLPFVRT